MILATVPLVVPHLLPSRTHISVNMGVTSEFVGSGTPDGGAVFWRLLEDDIGGGREERGGEGRGRVRSVYWGGGRRREGAVFFGKE